MCRENAEPYVFCRMLYWVRRVQEGHHQVLCSVNLVVCYSARSISNYRLRISRVVWAWFANFLRSRVQARGDLYVVALVVATTFLLERPQTLQKHSLRIAFSLMLVRTFFHYLTADARSGGEARFLPFPRDRIVFQFFFGFVTCSWKERNTRQDGGGFGGICWVF